MVSPGHYTANYEVKVRGCTLEKLVQNRLGHVPISLGNEAHYGDKFASILDWATAQHEQVIVSVTDIAYRHNYRMEGLTPLAAYRKAKCKGNEWLDQHGAILHAYREHILAIHRWHEWLRLAEFPVVAQRIQCYYEENAWFQRCVEDDVASFTQRYSNKNPAVEATWVAVMSRQFVMEECAVYVLFGRRYRANRLYPGGELSSMNCLRHADTPVELKGMENLTYVRLVFKHRQETLPDAGDKTRVLIG